MALDVLQGRPVIEDMPSGLKRITRFWKLLGDGATAANLEDYFDAFGTADAEFTTALLVGQRIDRRTEQGEQVTLVKVYQELADNALTATTEVTETTTFDGRRVTRTTYLCKSSQAAALRPAIGGTTFQVDVQKNGPVATVVKYDVTLTSMGFVLSDTTDTRNEGKLLVRTIRTLGSIANNPGGYTLISSGEQKVDGYSVFTATYANGAGRISSDISYKQKGKLKITTIRYLDTDDGAAPSGELVNDDSSAQDGYTVFTKSYAEIVGDGLISDEQNIRNNGTLVLYHKVRLGSAPATPAATIGGTVVLIETTERQEDGFTLYDYRWAEGEGEISRQTRDHLDGRITYTTVRALGTAVEADGEFETSEEEGDGYTIFISRGITVNSTDLPDQVETRANGAVTITTLRKIDEAPTGTGTLIDESASPQEGYTLYTRRYVVGDGDGRVRSESQSDGSITQTVTEYAATATTPANPGDGYLVALVQDPEDGFFVNTATYRIPPPDTTFNRVVQWRRPGAVLIASPNPDVLFTGGATMRVLADVEESYATSQVTTEPFTVEYWAGFNESYTIAATGQVVVRQEVLEGILSGALSGSGTDSVYHGVECSSYSYAIAASSPTSLPSEIVVDVENDIYLVALNGTVVYRRRVVTMQLPS
jgi:hypothetical protein